MIGLDCNILVQLAFAEHPANAKTVATVQTEVMVARANRIAYLDEEPPRLLIGWSG